VIRISKEELFDQSNQQRVQQFQEAQKIALVRPIGDPNELRKSSSGLIAILILSGAGLIGGLAAFLTQKLVFDVLSIVPEDNVTATNLTFTFVMAFMIGLGVSIIDAATSRVASKIAIAAGIAIPSSILLSLTFGAIANALYTSSSKRIIEEAYSRLNSGESEATVQQFILASNHFPRGLAWLFVGIAAGLTVGIASKSPKRTALTTAGGAVGGFLGGFIFDFIPQNLEWLAQSLGICITGLLVGSSMALLEQAARTQWIDIVAGGMAGKQFILYKSEIIIGSDPGADITLIKDSAIAPRHARIFTQGGRTILESLNPGMPCTVDGTADMRFYLQDMNTITLGSTSIRFREKKNQKQVQGGVARLS
jgi:Inner membrane component of T3SS, cytoplasmic domain